MSKREICLVVDVETANDLDNPLVYDLGFSVIVRATGEVLESHSLIIREVFYGMTDLMESAYYAKKLPQYHAGIASGEYRVVSLLDAFYLMRKIIREHGISRVYAYNMAFDRLALNVTLRYVTKSAYRWFFPYGTQTLCIWHMACRSFLNTNKFRRYAKRHGFVSPAGNVRTNAEVAFGYLTGEPHFTESHTGLADVEIETAIMSAVLRRKKRLYEKVFRGCWKIPQRRAA